jgi:hypothetical protein
MKLSEKDIKLLWGRAANRCAFPNCRVKLSQDKALSNEAFPLGEQAHIVAESRDGARGDSPLSIEDRNSYFNLILLGPNCHTIIDKNVEDYPVEKLHIIKAKHELWVEQTLSSETNLRQQASSLVYTSLIDAAVESCYLEDWQRWSGNAFNQPPILPNDATAISFEFRQRIMQAVWPGTIRELESALQTLSIAYLQFTNTVAQHARDDGKMLKGERFYQIDKYDPELDGELSEQYDIWIDECEAWFIELNKSLNWLADTVRSNINPMFFVTPGKFTLIVGPYEDLSYHVKVPEYTEQEKASQPKLIIDKYKHR